MVCGVPSFLMENLGQGAAIFQPFGSQRAKFCSGSLGKISDKLTAALPMNARFVACLISGFEFKQFPRCLGRVVNLH